MSKRIERSVIQLETYDDRYSRQETKPSQQQTRGNTLETTRYQNPNNEQGNSENLYAGGYQQRAGNQQQQNPSTVPAYRPPHVQNRMNIPK
jgi:hypothetical protein